jgi:hypothetical protein
MVFFCSVRTIMVITRIKPACLLFSIFFLYNSVFLSFTTDKVPFIIKNLTRVLATPCRVKTIAPPLQGDI